MRRRLLPVAIALVMGVAAPAFAAPDLPDKATRAEAESHFNKGVELSSAGSVRPAIAEFLRAYEILPNYRVLFNIAKLQVEAKDYVAAQRSFEKYLADGSAQVTPKRKSEVQDELKKIATHVALVTIKTNVDDVEVTIDDVASGTAPLREPVLLNAGTHKFVGKKAGRTPAEQSVDVPGGEPKTVSLELWEPTVAAVVPPPEVKPPPSSPPPKREAARIPWVGWAATGGLAVATAVTGVLALGATSKYDDKRGTFGITRGELENAQGSARTLVIVTGILAGATVVSAGVSTYLTLAGKKPALKEGRVGVVFGLGSIGAAGAF